MKKKLLIAHAKGEEAIAEKIAIPLRIAGYDPIHMGTIFVGESLVEEASKLLSENTPVLLCATYKAVATKWPRQLVNASRQHPGVKVFALQMDEEIFMEQLTLDEKYGKYWEDENNAIRQLIEALQKHYPVKEHNLSDDRTGDFIFEVPQFADQINRTSLLSVLNNLVETNSIVAVEGLAGSGKTYLVTSYLSNTIFRKNKQTIWYTPQNGETIETFLAQLAMQIPLSGTSTFSKCRELLSYINKKDILLVIDDFHQVDPISFSILIKTAVGYKSPANVILISRTYVDLLKNFPQIGRIEVRGFDFNDMKSFLKKRNIRGINQFIIERLINKTEGLPLAASLFATLVHDFNRKPDDLLSDSMLTTDRMKGWFEEVSASISGKESTLLNFLSVCDGPFNIGIVKWLGKLKHIEDIDQPFETLQRTYLVQRYSPYRWNIHHLISLFCVSQLNKMDIKAIHLALAQYYLKGFKLIDHRLHSENEFIWKVKACIQLQLAGDNKKSQGIIKNIQKTAKSRGFYETLKNLIENEIKTFSTRDTWLDYHYSHCCLITGKLKKGLDAIEPLLYTTEKNILINELPFQDYMLK